MLKIEIANWTQCGHVIEEMGFDLKKHPSTVTFLNNKKEVFELVEKFLSQKTSDDKPINVFITHGEGDVDYLLWIDCGFLNKWAEFVAQYH